MYSLFGNKLNFKIEELVDQLSFFRPNEIFFFFKLFVLGLRDPILSYSVQQKLETIPANDLNALTKEIPQSILNFIIQPLLAWIKSAASITLSQSNQKPIETNPLKSLLSEQQSPKLSRSQAEEISMDETDKLMFSEVTMDVLTKKSVAVILPLLCGPKAPLKTSLYSRRVLSEHLDFLISSK